MSRTPLSFAILILVPVLLLTPPLSNGQTQGIPWYTIPLPVPNGFVDVATGNVHLEIPMASIPERNGDTLVLKAMWESSAWSYNGGWGFSGPGWRVGAGTSHSGYGSWNSSTQDCVSAGYSPYDYGQVTYDYFYFVDNDGTSHNLSNSNYTKQVSCNDVTGRPYGSGDDIPSISGTAFDGSGYAFQVTNYSYLQVHAPDGTLVYDGFGGPYNTKYPVDTNGNYSNTQTVPDMLGRTPFQLHGNIPGYVCPNNTRSTATVSASDGSTNTYTFTCASFNVAEILFGTQYTATESFLTSIGLPDGTQYSFTYDTGTSGNHQGNLLSVTLPTGGVISFALISGGQTVTFGGGTWTLTSAANTPSQGQKTITVMSPLRYDSASNTNVSDKAVFVTVPNNLPYAQSAQYYRGSSTLLRTVSTTYSTDGFYLPLTVTTTLNDTGQSSSVSYQYFNGTYRDYPTQKQETDFGGSVIRTTVTQYNASFMKPASVNVYAGSNTSGTPASSTLYFYDEYSANYCKNGVPGLTSVTGATNHDDTNYGSSFINRGNVTTIQRLISGTTYATTHMCYDTLGNVTQTVDANGNPTSFDYSENWSDTYCIPSVTITHAFATTITDALGHQTKNSYFTCTSLRQSLKDANDIQANRGGTTFTYDLFNRPITVNYPDLGQTTYCYSHDPNLPCYTSTLPPFSTESRLISGSATLNTKTLLDSYGRVSETQLNSDSDCSSGDKTDTTYDALGRVNTLSNPYCTTSDPTYGSTTYNYDALGRSTSVTEQDGSKIVTSYSGNCTTVTDEAGKTRQSCSDGLGRLTRVTEDPGSSPHLNYLTTYSYDALDNLTGVVQNGSRQRTFNYDSLSRLLCASNPENSSAACPSIASSSYTPGTTGYTYDANGNPATKTALAPNQSGTATVTTTYTYDTLNRLTLKTYSDGTTPQAQYTYDANPPGGPIPNVNVIGRLATTWSPNYTGTKYNYDPMGRIATELQCIDYPCNWNSDSYYTYDLLGDMTAYTTKTAQWTNPPVNSITFNQSFDSAGRVTQLTSSWADPQHPGTLVAVDPSIGYFPHAALRKASLGNGLTLTNVFNNRLQPCHIDVNQSNATLQTCNDPTPAGNILDFWMTYSDGTNNGDVAHWNASSGPQNFARTYGYDQLNRLSTLSQTSGIATGCSSVFSLSWTYDAWGNRTDQTVTGGTCNAFHATANTKNQLVDIVNNKYQYDAAGNMIQDASHTYTYDAENHLIAVDGGSTASYSYDPLGRRASKTTGGTTYSYAYDLAGNVVYEYWGSSGWQTGYIYFAGRLQAEYNSNGQLLFVHKDHLGSTRLVTAFNQFVVDNLDYLPFGEQIAGDTSTTHKFTGKERDSESGNDYFGARYYSSSLGRFMSPDPQNAGASLDAPQSWNAYVYVLNNPLNAIDPTGLECVWDDGSYDDPHDHDSGDPNKCSNLGGTWVDHSFFVRNQLPDWSGDANGDIAGYAQSFQITVTANACKEPTAPFGSNASVKQNIQTTRAALIGSTVSGNSRAAAIDWWVQQVKAGGPWDYKAHYPGSNSMQHMTVSAFGNFNYGATCNALQLTLSTCQRGAGAVDFKNALNSVLHLGPWTAGPGNWLTGTPAIVNGQPDYGDQTNWAENPSVIAGYYFAQSGCGND